MKRRVDKREGILSTKDVDDLISRSIVFGDNKPSPPACIMPSKILGEEAWVLCVWLRDGQEATAHMDKRMIVVDNEKDAWRLIDFICHLL